ncbi:MAG: FAD-dependent oxidoreductase, partial [Acidobacteria bacterium]|nr:FAD-dependent oxidoreductase [Acidobacteriota bacterium]
DELGYNDFLFSPHGCGWHLDRRRFDAFLARAAAEAGCEVLTGTRFLGAEGDGGTGFRLRLAPGEVKARFVVDATGAGARFARCRGARRRFHDRLVCATAFFELPSESRFSRLTFLEAVKDGWWYAARLPGRRLVVAFASDSQLLKAAGAPSQEGLAVHLATTRHLKAELAGATSIAGSLQISAVSTSRLDRIVGDAWLAVGDAASTYDPISAQGVYKALDNALRAADAASSWLSGDPTGLEPYQRSVLEQLATWLTHRDYLYGLEQRWPSSPFWARRHRPLPVRSMREAGSSSSQSSASQPP